MSLSTTAQWLQAARRSHIQLSSRDVLPTHLAEAHQVQIQVQDLAMAELGTISAWKVGAPLPTVNSLARSCQHQGWWPSAARHRG